MSINQLPSKAPPACDSDNAQHVRITGPLSTFGEVRIVEPTPTLEVDFSCGRLVAENVQTHVYGGALVATVANNLVTVATSATANTYCKAESRRFTKYCAGRGFFGQWTSVHGTPAANSEQYAGMISPEAGIVEGYNGTTFGVLLYTGGVREIRTLTITTASNTAENVTITLNGSAKSVAVTAAGANSAATRLTTANEIAAADYSATGKGWDAYCLSASNPTVIFVARTAEPQAGTFSLTATTAVGSFARTQIGVTASGTPVPQTSWSHDRLDGSKALLTNASGQTLVPGNGNIWQVTSGYLGFAGPVLWWMNPTTKLFTKAHQFEPENTQATVSLSNPSLRVGAWVANASNTSNISMSCGSWNGSIDGKNDTTLQIQRRVARTNVSVNFGSKTPFFTIRNPRSFGGLTNYAVITMVGLSGSSSARNADFSLVWNATLTGPTAFTAYDSSGNSVLEIDTAATGYTGVSEREGLFIATGTSGRADIPARRYTLYPGETCTVVLFNGGASTTDFAIEYDEQS